MTSAMVQLIADGLTIGALYAVVGLGFVIVFRATKVLNFTAGAVATTAGFIAANATRAGVPYPVAVLEAVAVGLLMGAAIGLLLTRVFGRLGGMEASLVTIGVSYVITYFNRSFFGPLPYTTTRMLDGAVQVGGLRIQGHDLYVIGVAIVALLFTMWLINRTALGLAMRALSQDGPIARSLGVSNDVVSISAWVISSGLAALAGVLVSSFIAVDQNIMATMGIQSLMALILGGFGTAAGAIVGGVTLGVGSSLVIGYLEPALKGTIVFAAVLAILAFRPQGLVGRKEIIVQESGVRHNLPSLPTGLEAAAKPRRTRIMVGALVVALALAAILPFLPLPFPTVQLSVLFATAAVLVSLSFVIGYMGEFSLGHGALATIGAYTMAIALQHLGQDLMVLGLALAILVTGVVGAVISWATLRLTGLYLAIATLALVGVVTELGNRLRSITGGPLGMSLDVNFGSTEVTRLVIYYLAVAGFLAVAGVFAILLRSGLAIRWVAIRDVPTAALANGVAMRRQKVLAFAISAAAAGLGGAILATAVTHIGPADYGLTWSFVAVIGVLLGGAGSALGALGGTALVILVPLATSQSDLGELVFGITIILLLAIAPRGLPDAFERMARAMTGRMLKKPAQSASGL